MTSDNPPDVHQKLDELKALVEEKEGSPMNDKPELPAYLVAALCILGMIVLTLHGDTIPDTLNLVAIGALGVGGAITTPRGPRA